MPPIKSKELAEMLGVSTAAISLVINNKPGIADDTRRNIIERITELGYGYMIKDNPNVSGNPNVDSIRNTTRNIAFVIYKRGGELMEQSPFFPLMVDGLEAAARRNGFNLLIINVSKQMDAALQMRYIQDSNCVGYVVFATEMIGDDVIPFEQLGIPFVLLDNYYIDRKINCVKLNNEQGTDALVKHLVEMGHKTIGYLDSGVEIPSFIERKECYQRALRRYGIGDMEPFCFTVGYPEQNAYTQMKELLRSSPELPTAFLTDNDLIAFGAVKAMSESGITVPGDVSIVGFDDRPICTMMDPQLTTVKIPRASFGAEAVELLSMLIRREAAVAKEAACLKTEIAVQLVIRNSVCKQ